MAEQQTGTTGQNEPLNSTTEGGGTTRTTDWRVARIKIIREKVLPGFRITLLISLVVNIAMLIVGIIAVNKCPVQENIPLFLIVTGVIGLISKIITSARERIMRHFKTSFIESTLYTVEIVFLLMGSYWVYKVYPPSYEPADGKLYCQKTAYLFAFIYLTFFYAIAVCILCGFLCFLCCLCLLAAAPDPDVEAQVETVIETRREEKAEPKTETA